MPWTPLRPLSDDDLAIDAGDVRTLVRSWETARQRLEQASPIGLAQLREQLVRAHAVAAGIADRMFDLAPSAAEVLIQQGFAEELVPRPSTDVDPEVLVDILRDHVAAMSRAVDAAGDGARITEPLLHLLHGVITRHQLTTSGLDDKGRRRRIPLTKGAFRETLLPDRRAEDVCPPDRIQGEVDRLLGYLHGYDEVDPMLVAAWLVHAFDRTEPYQDGNGRLALTLMNLILMRRGLMPVAIAQRHRASFQAGLLAADDGDLRPLVQLIGSLQKGALLQALSVEDRPEISAEGGATSAVIAGLEARVRRRRTDRDESLRRVNAVAISVRGRAREFLEEAFSKLANTLEPLGQARVHMRDGGPDRGNAHWYRADVLDTVRQGRKWVNFDEDHYFLKASIRFANDRLVFVVSLHHVGRELSGVMEATAFAHLEAFEDLSDTRPASISKQVCSTESFVITWESELEDIEDPLVTWLDDATAVALKAWVDRL